MPRHQVPLQERKIPTTIKNKYISEIQSLGLSNAGEYIDILKLQIQKLQTANALLQKELLDQGRPSEDSIIPK
jgi:hypothetical protein